MNYQEASDDTVKLFKERIVSQHLDTISWGVLSDDSLKMSVDHMCGKLVINNPLARARYNEDVLFIINENVFDRLSELNQIITVDKLLAEIEYNLEKDTVKKKKKDIQEHSGILTKYAFDTKLQVLYEEISSIYEEIEDEQARNDGKKQS